MLPRAGSAPPGARGSLTAMLLPKTLGRFAQALMLLAFCAFCSLCAVCFFSCTAYAAEQVTLRNGFDIACDHTQSQGTKTLLYLDATSSNYVEVKTAEIATATHFDEPPSNAVPMKVPRIISGKTRITAAARSETLTADELKEILQGAGRRYDLDIDLLASVIHAESNSHVRARSRAGAEGLMQLMPGTAAALGVNNAFAPGENVHGGAAYLDSLLHRYHGNLAWALAAYNAGPGAVDHWHGIPPYRETRAYVARIIHEFNRRYAARRAAALARAETASAARP